MEKSTEQLIDEIRAAKVTINMNSEQLAHRVMKMGVEQALTEGLIKFNFPAPPGLLNHLKRVYRKAN